MIIYISIDIQNINLIHYIIYGSSRNSSLNYRYSKRYTLALRSLKAPRSPMIHSFTCIDAHTCGNPVRLVAEGGPELEGKNMSEKRQHFLKEYDWIRTGLMFEPRGHDMMSGSILYPAYDPQNDFAVLFIETSGCLPMCGHGTIGTVTIAIEENLIIPKVRGTIKMEAPAGVINISYKEKEGKVTSVKLTNVPSFLAAENCIIDLPGYGILPYRCCLWR